MHFNGEFLGRLVFSWLRVNSFEDGLLHYIVDFSFNKDGSNLVFLIMDGVHQHTVEYLLEAYWVSCPLQIALSLDRLLKLVLVSNLVLILDDEDDLLYQLIDGGLLLVNVEFKLVDGVHVKEVT